MRSTATVCLRFPDIDGRGCYRAIHISRGGIYLEDGVAQSSACNGECGKAEAYKAVKAAGIRKSDRHKEGELLIM